MPKYEPVTLRHPETGDEITAATAREENNLRYAQGYQPVEKPAPRRETPKPAAPKNDAAE